MDFIFSYNDNSLSLEEMKKFEEHLESCEKCRYAMSKDKTIIDSFRKEESIGMMGCSKDKLMESIPFGMYAKNPVKYHMFSLFNRGIPAKSVLVKVAAAVIMLALVLNNQAIISNITNTVDVVLKHGNGNITENPDTSGVERPRLTEGRLVSDSIINKESKNIMLIGENGAGTYDLISALSIDEKNKHLKVIIIPENIKVDYSSYVENKLSYDKTLDASEACRIKNAPAITSQMSYKGKFQSDSVSFLSDVIKEKFGITVDQYIKFDFEGLGDIVDLLGGVEVDIPYKMDYDDPIQNISIHLDKGKQHLDGKMAKFFVTFRLNHGRFGSVEDYDSRNANNKAIFMEAFIKQKVKASNMDKLSQLFNVLDNKMEHSFDVKNNQSDYIKYLEDVNSGNYTIDTLIIEEG